MKFKNGLQVNTNEKCFEQLNYYPVEYIMSNSQLLIVKYIFYEYWQIKTIFIDKILFYTQFDSFIKTLL